MKLEEDAETREDGCRPPRGGRGLKSVLALCQLNRAVSPPARGAWIEILMGSLSGAKPKPSPPARGAWIEIWHFSGIFCDEWSPPARGTWIEIGPYYPWRLSGCVAPREGGVD